MRKYHMLTDMIVAETHATLQEPTPVPMIRDMKEAAQFYSNRVIKEYKEK